jgi:hypothetical protein
MLPDVLRALLQSNFTNSVEATTDEFEGLEIGQSMVVCPSLQELLNLQRLQLAS